MGWIDVSRYDMFHNMFDEGFLSMCVVFFSARCPEIDTGIRQCSQCSCQFLTSSTAGTEGFRGWRPPKIMGELHHNSASLAVEEDAAEIQRGSCLGSKHDGGCDATDQGSVSSTVKVAEEVERPCGGELQHRAEGADANPGGCSSGIEPEIQDTDHPDAAGGEGGGEEGGGGNTRVDDSSSFRARAPPLPSGWLESSDCGNPIPFPEGSRGHQEGWAGFLPCKVPLQAAFGQDFTPDELVARQAALGREIGLVVDLTFTSRYYRGQIEFEEKGIRHKKIMVQVREA
jgi:hypothetical protein